MTCPDFEGKETCKHFIEGGPCKLPGRFMCELWLAWQPGGKFYHIVKETKRIFPESEVVKTVAEQQKGGAPPTIKQKLVDLFGEIV